MPSDTTIGRFFDAMEHADFFEAGKTYIRDEPYRAPELLHLFVCVAVAPNPRNGELRAFGFANTALRTDRGWYSTALTPGQWSSGWVETEEN